MNSHPWNRCSCCLKTQNSAESREPLETQLQQLMEDPQLNLNEKPHEEPTVEQSDKLKEPVQFTVEKEQLPPVEESMIECQRKEDDHDPTKKHFTN